jgi:hypothetical protein
VWNPKSTRARRKRAKLHDSPSHGPWNQDVRARLSSTPEKPIGFAMHAIYERFTVERGSYGSDA